MRPGLLGETTPVTTLSIFLRAIADLISLMREVFRQKGARRNAETLAKANSFEKLKKALQARNRVRAGNNNPGGMPADQYKRD